MSNGRDGNASHVRRIDVHGKKLIDVLKEMRSCTKTWCDCLEGLMQESRFKTNGVCMVIYAASTLYMALDATCRGMAENKEVI